MIETRILIVEDENILVLDLESQLKSLGYTVLAAVSSGEQAVCQAAEMHPDLVLMDIRLKGKMDGIEAAEQIRARFGIPVIYLTAYADKATLERAKVAEPFGYILKPFGERELSATIEMALYRHKLEQRLQESERWLSATLKSIGDAVIATDDKRRIRFINPVAETLTGWKQDEVLGRDLSQVFHIINEETRAVAENLVVEALREGVTIGLRKHTVLVARDGTETPIDDSAAPIRDEEGNITGVVLVFRDVTGRRRAERLLQALNRASRAMGQALTPEEIFAAVAEEFTQLGLSCMLFPTDESQGKLFPKYLSYESKALRAAERLVGLSREGFTILVEAVDIYREAIWERKAVFIERAEDVVRQLLPVPAGRFAGQIVRMLNTSKSIVAPLIVEDRVIGVFSVQSDDLIDADIPTITAFAHQVAAAWRKAQLLEQAQREIAERRRVEDALRESEGRYRNIVELAPDGILTVSLKGVATSCNSAFLELTGFSRDEIVGKHISRFPTLRLEDIPKYIRIILSAARGKTIKPFEFIWIHKDGTSRWGEAHIGLMKKDSRVVGLQLILRDITERKQAEETLRKSEERYRLIAENVTDVIWAADMNFCFTYISPSVEHLRGYSAEEVMAQSLSDVLAPASLVRATKILEEERENIERGIVQPRIVELEFKCKDGSTVQTESTVSVLYDENEIPVGLLGSTRDITERKRAEEEILRLQHLLQNVTDSMPSALVTLDPAGRVLTWNPAAKALTGRTAAQMQGQYLWQTCPALARYRDLFERVLSDGQVAHRPREQLTSEAGTTYRDVSIFPLIADDAIEGTVLRLDDVTRRVQLEEMMLQSAKMASVGGLAAGVAHEINNPLAVMMQSAQMLQIAFDTQHTRTRESLQEHGVDPEGLDRYLQARGLLEYLHGIRSAGERAARIVADLLTFSRKKSFDVAPHDLNVLVAQTLDLAATDYSLKEKYDFRDIEIVRELAPDLPPVVCDGQQIQQVVLNLVRNAAQAMAEEIKRGNEEYRPRLTLRTSLVPSPSPLAPGPSFVRLEVEDNGPGIPEAMQARLFEPFFTTKDVGGGTGLGLWLCWSIVVERHGGRIWVESEGLGHGSTFGFSIPTGMES